MAIRPPTLREKFGHLIQAGAFYLFVGISRIIGLKASSFILGKITKTLGPHVALNRRAQKNLMLAMPALDESARRKIIRDMWENLGRTLGEYPHLQHLADNRDHYVKVVGFEKALDVMARYGRGIYISGHFANWEVLVLLPLSHYEGALVYRAPNNPFIDAWITKQRQRIRPLTPVSKSIHGARAMTNILKNGGYLCALIDQKLSGGIPVPFFGHPAPTSPTIARLALRHKCPVVPVGIERTHGTHFTITVHTPLFFRDDVDDEQKILDLTRRLNLFLESEISMRPSQWLWLHRRWGKERDTKNS